MRRLGLNLSGLQEFVLIFSSPKSEKLSYYQESSVGLTACFFKFM